jgi:hypothetical protein
MIAGVAVVVGVAGCGTSTVSASDIAAKAKTLLNQQLAARGGPQLDSVKCPNDLDAKVGASETCNATGTGGTKLDVTATVTAFKSGTASLHFSLAPASGGTSTGTTST